METKGIEVRSIKRRELTDFDVSRNRRQRRDVRQRRGMTKGRDVRQERTTVREETIVPKEVLSIPIDEVEKKHLKTSKKKGKLKIKKVKKDK